MEQQRMIKVLEATFPQGPRHQEIWTSTITLTDPNTGVCIGTFTANASTKQAARDEASKEALLALGVNIYSLPA
ncbi:hypothetical protein FRB90_006768 [Tulasnella sp. 427]|nr:hypothetical protein FRB90_006768 [Tulasnella sp. 427]